MRLLAPELNSRYPPLPSLTQTGPSPPSNPSALSVSSFDPGARILSRPGSILTMSPDELEELGACDVCETARLATTVTASASRSRCQESLFIPRLHLHK